MKTLEPDDSPERVNSPERRNSPELKNSPELNIPFITSYKDSDAIALMDDSGSLSYRELSKAVQRRADDWQRIINCDSRQRPVVMLFIDNSMTSVIDYLAALTLDYVVLLLNPNCTPATKAEYSSRLRPNVIIDDGQFSLLHHEFQQIDPRLSLLLSTSGSTGAGKCVALSHHNITANCDAILTYLPIEAEDITLATLPLSYSYGLSVLHTHLSMGATVCFTRHSVFDKGFWNIVKHHPISSLSGVPSFYEMLLRLRFTTMALPHLRYFTQAGGKLAESCVTRLAKYAHQMDKAFYVMYGQTEATARMAYLSPDKVMSKPNAVGKAIAGGEFKLVGNTARPGEGELYYRGDNVMLGYVSDAADLDSFLTDEWLATGDLAIQDADGDYIITGRIKRMVKVAGERTNLDVIEQVFLDTLEQHSLLSPACVIGEDDKLIAVYAGELSGEQRSCVIESLSTSLSLPKRIIALNEVESLPLLSNGKVDYAGVSQLVMGVI